MGLLYKMVGAPNFDRLRHSEALLHDVLLRYTTPSGMVCEAYGAPTRHVINYLHDPTKFEPTEYGRSVVNIDSAVWDYYDVMRLLPQFPQPTGGFNFAFYITKIEGDFAGSPKERTKAYVVQYLEESLAKDNAKGSGNSDLDIKMPQTIKWVHYSVDWLHYQLPRSHNTPESNYHHYYMTPLNNDYILNLRFKPSCSYGVKRWVSYGLENNKKTQEFILNSIELDLGCA